MLLFGSLAINISAFAQVQNVLESQVVTGKDFAILSVDGTSFTLQSQVSGANLTDCEATPDGTFCIDDGTNIVDLSDYPGPVITCEAVGFEAKGKRPAQCTAIAVADGGTFYIAGILNKNGSAIFKCVSGACDLLVQGRPPIRDLDRVPSGLIYVENKNAVVLLTNIDGGGAPIIETVANSRDFGLAKGKVKEELLNVARIVTAAGMEGYAVTTSFGRLIAFTSAGGVFMDLAEVDLNDVPVAESCTDLEQDSYDVTQDADRGGSLYALVSNTCNGNVVHTFDNDLSNGFDLSTVSSATTTVGDAPDTVTYNGLTISVFEGHTVSFGACGVGLLPPCPLGSAATLTFNHVDGTAETGSVWEIPFIPHCAWIPELCLAPLAESQQNALICDGKDPQACMCDEGVLRVVGPLLGGAPIPTPAECAAADPGLLDFNPVPILPRNLIAEFDDFPDELWMPPYFEAQDILNRHFDALLIDAGDGQSGEPAVLVVDAEGVYGAYGCPESDLVDSPLQSSVVLRMREGPLTGGTCSTHPTTGVRSCELDERMGSHITFDCVNPLRSRGCCSLFPLDVALARKPPAQMIDTSNNDELRWYLDTLGIIDFDDDPKNLNPIEDDSAAAKFIDWHFENLEVFEWAACTKGDNEPSDPDLAPLNGTTCDKLEQIRNNARKKLFSAFSNTAAAGSSNNCSQASRNYQSFISQINVYVTEAGFREDTFPLCNDGIDNDGDKLVDGDDPDCTLPIPRDRAGRIEALVAHASVLPYAVDRILLPTIPLICETGWLEDNDEWWEDLDIQ